MQSIRKSFPGVVALDSVDQQQLYRYFCFGQCGFSLCQQPGEFSARQHLERHEQ